MVTKLFIELNVQDGEREHTHKVLHTTKCQNLDFAVQWYLAHFWGESTWQDNAWYAWGGEIAISLSRYKVLTDKEFEMLNQFI